MKYNFKNRLQNLYAIAHFIFWIIVMFKINSPYHNWADEGDYIWFSSIDMVLNVRELCSNYFLSLGLVILSMYTVGIYTFKGKFKHEMIVHIIVFTASIFGWLSMLYDSIYFVPCILSSASPFISLLERPIIKRLDNEQK